MRPELDEAQLAQFKAWRLAGFDVVWFEVLQDFIMVGDPPDPQHYAAKADTSRHYAVFTRAEVQAMGDWDEERVRCVARVKKAFGGKLLGISTRSKEASEFLKALRRKGVAAGIAETAGG